MTLVAQGAALYAATAGLDARAAAAAAPTRGRQVWLQYPAVSSDLTPHVVGKFVDAGPGPSARQAACRNDGALVERRTRRVDADGAFVLARDAAAAPAARFTIEARDARTAQPVAVSPADASRSSRA